MSEIDEMEEIISEFITEAEESLDNIEPMFVELEKKGEYNPEELVEFLKTLGIFESETKSYLELVIEKERTKII